MNTVRGIDFTKLVEKSKIGEIWFSEDSLKNLLRLQRAIIELEDFWFHSVASWEEKNNIVNTSERWIRIANNLESFDLKNANSHQVKQNIDEQISFIIDNLFPRVRSVLTYLREENAKSPTESEARKIISDLNKIKKEAEESLRKSEIDKKAAEAGRGIASAQVFAHKFLEEAYDNKESADKKRYTFWIPILFGLGFLLIAIIFGLYCWLLVEKKVDASVRIEFAVLAFTLFSLYFYLLRYVLRWKNILLHNFKVNKHRANVAETVLSFMKSWLEDAEVKTKLLDYGVRVMFEPESTGYLVKDQMEVSSPISPISASLDLSKIVRP